MDDRKMVKILVPTSGGKDSQLCLELAIEAVGVDHVRGLYCDTQWDHPDTHAHIDAIRQMYGVRIDRVCEGSVPEKVEKYGRFPSGTARFCTDELKIRPTIRYAKQLAQEQGGFEIWYGVRWDESNERAKRYEEKIGSELYPPHEYMPGKYPKYLAKLGVSVRLPILEWPTWQVVERMKSKRNPLYADFDRVGCYPCLAAGDDTKERAFERDEFGAKQKVIVIELEKKTGKSVWTSEGGAQRNNPDQMCLICKHG